MDGEEIEQLLVPKLYRRALLKAAHELPMAGHLGRGKAEAKLLERVYWLGMHREVADYCSSCTACLLVDLGKPKLR